MLSSSLDLESPLFLRAHTHNVSLMGLTLIRTHVCACTVVSMPFLDDKMLRQGERGFAIHEVEDTQMTLTALTASRAGYALLAS